MKEDFFWIPASARMESGGVPDHTVRGNHRGGAMKGIVYWIASRESGDHALMTGERGSGHGLCGNDSSGAAIDSGVF